MIPLSQPITQEAFGRLVGVDQSTVSRLQGTGVLADPLVVGEALLAYCGRLREQAAGRQSETEGGLSLSQERAAWTRARRQLAEAELARVRGEYAPIQLLGEVLASASQAVAERLDQLPGLLRRGCPGTTDAQLQLITKTVNNARNEWVRQTVALVAEAIVSPEDLPDEETPP